MSFIQRRLVARGLLASAPALLLTAMGLLLASGCAPTSSNEASWSTRTQAIQGGIESDNDSVVLVMGQNQNGVSLCTGTLLSPRLILTARHCVSNYVEGTYSCTIDGNLDLSRPRTPANAGEMGTLIPGENVTVHAGLVPDLDYPTGRGVQILAADTTDVCRNDIALVVLDESLDLPVSAVRLGKGLAYGEKVTVAGYGQNEQRLTERRERAGVGVLGIGPSDFFAIEGQAMPRTFIVESSACHGDSGGPAISDETGEILGVFSLLRGDCTSSEARDIYTQVAPFEDLLRRGFEAAGAELPRRPDEGKPADSADGGAGGTIQTGSGGDEETPAARPTSDASGCQITGTRRPSAGSVALGGWLGLLFWTWLGRKSAGGRCFFRR